MKRGRTHEENGNKEGWEPLVKEEGNGKSWVGADVGRVVNGQEGGCAGYVSGMVDDSTGEGEVDGKWGMGSVRADYKEDHLGLPVTRISLVMGHRFLY